MGQWITIAGKPIYIYDHQYLCCHECGEVLQDEDKNISINDKSPSIVPYTNGENKFLCEPCVEMYKEEMEVEFEDHYNH